VIVIGAGHAGCEAARACARIGLRTAMVTMNIDLIAQMSCNPAIGGIAKGHLVREIDALGGVMGEVTDAVGIQFRLLNTSRGPAVWSPRAQCDKKQYRIRMRDVLEKEPNLRILQAEVAGLVFETNAGRRVTGVRLQDGREFHAPAVIVTTGTFLNGLAHVGEQRYSCGRNGEAPSNLLGDQLRTLGLAWTRLKTGTPPRLDGRTIDWHRFESQAGDDDPTPFSFLTAKITREQIKCYIGYTNEETRKILQQSIARSPLYSGQIEGVGPRYCPSIEDKIHRFADKEAHQVFLEPEGLDTHEIYPNGISTSLPFDVQIRMVRSMVGLENAHIVRPGYAIEYDYYDPRALRASLETRAFEGLFFAGQINGTTGYEEAAAQGILAGINAALKVSGRSPFVPRRDQAYLGVLIDDLTVRGVSEPYRMFTSRAEYRLSLREDNADLRLTELGRELGCVDDRRWDAFIRKRDAIAKELERLKSTWVNPKIFGDPMAESIVGQAFVGEHSLAELLKRPAVRYAELVKHPAAAPGVVDPAVAEQVETQLKYAGYIDRQTAEVARNLGHESTRLPESLDYGRVPGLSIEVRQKLSRFRPETLGQAGRISGVTPAAISILLVFLKKNYWNNKLTNSQLME
jgi:tRNA uridine 5-carboxymethylaminomethyl modification enzyme